MEVYAYTHTPSMVHYKKYIDVNAELLKILRKEYHLK
jgi:hypothetical protein